MGDFTGMHYSDRNVFLLIHLGYNASAVHYKPCGFKPTGV